MQSNANAIPFNLDTSEDISILDNTPAKKKRTSEQQLLKNQKSNARKKEKSRLDQVEQPVQTAQFEQAEEEEEEEDTIPRKRNIKSHEVSPTIIIILSIRKKK